MLWRRTVFDITEYLWANCKTWNAKKAYYVFSAAMQMSAFVGFEFVDIFMIQRISKYKMYVNFDAD